MLDEIVYTHFEWRFHAPTCSQITVKILCRLAGVKDYLTLIVIIIAYSKFVTLKIPPSKAFIYNYDSLIEDINIIFIRADSQKKQQEPREKKMAAARNVNLRLIKTMYLITENNV